MANVNPCISEESQSFGARTWERLDTHGDGYSPRTGHTVVAYKDSLYVFGGTDKRRRQQDLFQYHLSNSTWNRVVTSGTLPPRRSGAHGIVHDSKFYIFGGYDGRDGNYYNDLYYFDFETRLWNEVLPNHYGLNLRPMYSSSSPSSSFSSSSAVAAGIPNAVSLSTSSTNNTANINMMETSPITSSSMTPIESRISHPVYPEPRTDHIMVLYNSHIYIFGGYDGRCKYDSMYSYSLGDQRWDMVIPTSVRNPSRRFGHAGAVHETTGKLFIFGGWDGKDTLNDLYAYSFHKNEWELIQTGGQIPPHRYRHTVVIYENNLFLFGGVNKAHSRFNDLYRLDLKTFIWSEVLTNGHAPSSRTFHRAVVANNKMYLLGGYDGTDRLHDLFSVLVGPLVPNSLLEITAKYTRENIAEILKHNTLDNVPEDLIGNVIWGRDANRSLRGKCLICREGLCAFYESGKTKRADCNAPLNDYKAVACICGHTNIDHEYINERILRRPTKRLLLTPMNRFLFEKAISRAS